MAKALPLIASVAVASFVPGGFTLLGLSAGATSALLSGAAGLAASFVVGVATRPKTPDLPALLDQAGAGRTQQVRQPTSPHQVPLGRIKQSGPILFVHTKADDEGRENGYLYLIHALAGVPVREIGDVYFGEDLATDSKYTGLQRVNKHLGAADQVADTDLVSEIGDPNWGANHRLRGRAYTATRLKWDGTAYGSGIPNIAAIVLGWDEIYDPRSAA